MALKRAPIAHETTQTTGTGNYTLDGAIDAERAPFDQDMDTGDTVYMMVRGDGNNWEINLSTFTAPSTLSRNVLLSAAGGVVGTAAVNWATGTKDVYSLPDIDFVSQADFLQAANNLSDVQDAGASRTNLGLGTAAQSNDSDFVQLSGVSSQVIVGFSGATDLTIRGGGLTGPAIYRLQSPSASTEPDHFGEFIWDHPEDRLQIQIDDTGTGAVPVVSFVQGEVRILSGVDLLLNHDPVQALEAATRQYVDNEIASATAGALLYSTGDETIFGGASLPPGTSIVTTAANDRIPLFVDTLAETKANAGTWDSSTGLSISVTVNSHTLTLAQTPPHDHDFTIKLQDDAVQSGASFTKSRVLSQASAGNASFTYTTTSKGSGNAHSHTASGSASSNSTWRPLHRTFVVISKS